MSDSLQPHRLQHARLPCPSLSPGICSNSCLLSLWCHPTILSPVAPSPHVLSLAQHQAFFQGAGSLHQVACIGTSASILPVTVEDWFLLGLSGLISLLSKGLSRVFFSTTVCKHQFFSAQPSQVVKASACNVGEPGSFPGLGRSPGEGNGNPLQYSCLENSMDGGAW